MRVVAFVPDLMDRSRVSGPAAAAPGVELAFVASVGALAGAVEGADLVLVDLGRAGALEAAAAAAGAGAAGAAGAAGVAAGPRVVGFVSHVDAAALTAATAAGVEALPRSVFFRRLPELLDVA